MINYNSKEYKHSRLAYIGHCTFEYFVSLLVTDAYLANLLSNMGISDGVIGIISSLVTFAFLFKLGAIFVMQKISNIKKTSIIFHISHQIIFMLLYLIPFLNVSTQIKSFLVTIAIISAYCCNYIVMSIIFKWGNSYVDPKHRAEFSATKEMVSLIAGMIFTLIIGQIIDRYASIGNIMGGFLFISSAIFILGLCNFICLLKIKNGMGDGEIIKPNNTPIRDVIKHLFKNKSYRSICYFTIMWDITRYMLVGYIGIYKTKNLLLTVGTVQIINIFANLCRFLLSKPIGRFSDKYSYAKGIELGACILTVSFFSLIFCTTNTWWIIIIHTVLYNVSIAGTNQNLSNITYDYVDSKYFVQASAIKSAIGGLCGFLTSIIASKILSDVQANGNTFLGFPMYGQQLLAVIATVLGIVSILYLHFKVAKQKKFTQ